MNESGASFIHHHSPQSGGKCPTQSRPSAHMWDEKTECENVTASERQSGLGVHSMVCAVRSICRLLDDYLCVLG